METLLTSDRPLLNEALRKMQGWYKTASDHPLYPVRITLANIMADQVEIYLQVPPPGDSISIDTYPFPIDYSIYMVENIEWAVCCLRYHQSGGIYNMRTESFQSWLEAADKITEDRVELYCQVPPSRVNIVIETPPFPIDYSIYMVDNIEWAVCCLR